MLKERRLRTESSKNCDRRRKDYERQGAAVEHGDTTGAPRTHGRETSIRAIRHISEYAPILAELWRRAGFLQIGHSQTFASAVRCCGTRRMVAGTFACPKGESDCGGEACRSINAALPTGTGSAGMAANRIGVLARLRNGQRPRK